MFAHCTLTIGNYPADVFCHDACHDALFHFARYYPVEILTRRRHHYSKMLGVVVARWEEMRDR
jgi:hypothetical protein